MTIVDGKNSGNVSVLMYSTPQTKPVADSIFNVNNIIR